MIDGRDLDLAFLKEEYIRELCHRRFGIGADGLIVLASSPDHDFTMRYYNADGREGSMCGNGGRCIVAFAHRLGVTGTETRFEGIDGVHHASLLPDGKIRIKLSDVKGVRKLEDGVLLDTGSPHFVKYVQNLDQVDMETEGRKIRHEKRFGQGGVNVNFVETGKEPDALYVRTFERGVEAETLSCGTGVTAAAISSQLHRGTANMTCHVRTPGGKLQVSFEAGPGMLFTEIFLTGPVSHVYDGTIQAGH